MGPSHVLIVHQVMCVVYCGLFLWDDVATAKGEKRDGSEAVRHGIGMYSHEPVKGPKAPKRPSKNQDTKTPRHRDARTFGNASFRMLQFSLAKVAAVQITRGRSYEIVQ